MEGLSEVAKKERLKKDIEVLRAELNQLDAQIILDEAQLVVEGESHRFIHPSICPSIFL